MYSAAIRNSSSVAASPRFNSTGFRFRPAAFSSEKFCMFLAPIWITSAYSATSSSASWSMASVTIRSPNRSRTSAMIFSASSPSPWNAYGEVRGLYAPPRKNCAPAAATCSAIVNACSRDSIEHGPAIIASFAPPIVASVPANRITVSSSFTSRLTSLYGFETRITSATPASSSMFPRSTSPWLPVIPIAVRCAPGSGCARYPSPSICSQTALISSGVACAFITTSMVLPSLELTQV